MKNNILILSYFFPPCNKVGGRRWAKFGKYFSRHGYNVNVISVDVPFTGKCPWEKDIELYKENITRLPYVEHRPFYRVNKSPASIPGKVRYRLSRAYEKLFLAGSDTRDISLNYGKNLRKNATKVIEEKMIGTVIVTGGPFHWCYEAMKLKEKFPQLNFILDLRDFWTGGELYNPLDEKDKRVEDMKEGSCVSSADHVFSPAEKIVDHLKQKYPDSAKKIKVLPHAFDKEEIPVQRSEQVNDAAISFAYGGIMYSKMEPAIANLIQLLKQLVHAGRKVSLDIYTFDQNYKELFSDAGLTKEVNYHPVVSPSELFAIFQKKDYLLQLRAGESQEQHFKSTKFYELIALRKPIIYFGPEGDVSKFIVDNNLGFSGNMESSKLAKDVVENKDSKRIPAKDLDISKFEFEDLTRELEAFV